MTKLIVAFSVLFTVTITFANGGEINSERLLYKKAIGDGREIAVIRGPFRDPTAVAVVVPGYLAKLSRVIFSVRIELRDRDDKVTLLWSRLLRLSKDEASEDLNIFDLLLSDGSVYVANSWFGDLHIWKIDLVADEDSNFHDEVVPGWEWSHVALA